MPQVNEVRKSDSHSTWLFKLYIQVKCNELQNGDDNDKAVETVAMTFIIFMTMMVITIMMTKLITTAC